MKRFITYIMRPSGESRAGLSGCSENGLRELRKENGLGFLWCFWGRVLAGRRLYGLNFTSGPKGKHWGFLSRLPRCGQEGKGDMCLKATSAVT